MCQGLTDPGKELAEELLRWTQRLHIALPQSLYDRACALAGVDPNAWRSNAELERAAALANERKKGRNAQF